MDSKMKVLITCVLIMLPLLAMATDGRQTLGEYWGERAIEEMTGQEIKLTPNYKGQSEAVVDLVKDLDLASSHLFVLGFHHQMDAKDTIKGKIGKSIFTE